MFVPYAHTHIHLILLNCATTIIKCCLYVCCYPNVTNGNKWILYCIVLYWLFIYELCCYCEQMQRVNACDGFSINYVKGK